MHNVGRFPAAAAAAAAASSTILAGRTRSMVCPVCWHRSVYVCVFKLKMWRKEGNWKGDDTLQWVE